MRGSAIRPFGTIASLVLLMMLGCSKRGGGGSASMEVAELGLSMSIPPGWQLDRNNPRMCTQGDDTGLVLDEQLEGKAFREYVDQLCLQHGGRVRSKTQVTISGREAVLAAIDYPEAGSASIKAYIHDGQRLIEVSFVAAKEDFARQEASFRRAIETIQLR